MKEAPKFRLEDVSYTYDGRSYALRDVSLSIYPRQVTAIFGPAAGGKSTLLRLLNRLNDLVEGGRMEGRVLLDGEDIYRPGLDVTALRRRVGMVFATPVPLPMTIRHNLTYGPQLAGVRDRRWLEQKIRESLEAAALWDEVKDRLDDPASELSGGQQQRLCLARTLMLEPEVILLDAPTSGLDPISTAKVEDSLQQLKRDYTVVIVPHNVQQAARVADYAVFMLQGELIEEGLGEELFTRPRDQRTEDYITGRFG
ncbi:MAG TPA: phosphate ABC transporter ATP-binding protein [Anaerolineales bacterium]|nr:phosphate ABC transporter ATP-binding protein [Anaerolineae bacterium]HIQ01436.1 phosphate ABC transporter ATP-binding protein [Anaerolineales bacterium]